MNAVYNAADWKNVDFNDFTDEELFLEYRNFNSRRCFDALVRRYQTRLTAYLRRRVGSREIAEDAFQAAFLRAMTKCDLFDAEKRFRPWLYRIALNQAIDLKRRSKYFDEAISLDAKSPAFEDASLADALPGREPDPRWTTEESETAQRVRRAVAELPENLRQILEMVFFQGLKRYEAAEYLQIAPGAVKNRLRSALRQFRRSAAFDPIPAINRF